jgi:translation initiation factor 4E
MELRLNHQWTLWYDKTDLTVCDDNWDQFLIKIQSINTFEKFWNLFNNTPSIFDLPIGSNFHFFIYGIEPKWEDFQNLNGGKWVISFPRSNSQDLEKIWESSLLALVSGRFSSEGTRNINGLVVNVRKNEIRFSIWTKNADNETIQLKIGNFWKKIMQDDIKDIKYGFDYFPHSSS